MDCHHKAGDDCDGTEAAGVVCATAGRDIPQHCMEEDRLCLVGGGPGSGNVYYGGHPVCHNGWDFTDANVVCRALGFSGASNFTIRSTFGLSTTFFSWSNVDCRGDESSLLECPHDENREGCEADTVAGAVCIASVEAAGGYFEMVLGVCFAVLILSIAIGFTLVWGIRNRKLKSLKPTIIGLPKLSFKNPIVKNMETPNANGQPVENNML
jgi:hypothetical protein